MKRIPHCPLACLLVFSLVCALSVNAYDRLQSGLHRGNVAFALSYLLYLPQGYDETENWPLVLFLHGAGERGKDLEKLYKHGLPKLIAQGQQFPFIMVAPQVLPERRWEPIELISLLDDLEQTLKLDKQKVYVTGLSMGAYGTWELAAYAPERIAAIVPISGVAERHWAKSFKSVPVWAFHGEDDKVASVTRVQSIIMELQKAGAAPKFTVYPNTGHKGWIKAYQEPKLYRWLLEQSLAYRK